VEKFACSAVEAAAGFLYLLFVQKLWLALALEKINKRTQY
jgi:hypothetical protein